ncbi:MAG: hypothetical protein WCT04_12440 [Planctomycetota bacterium]
MDKYVEVNFDNTCGGLPIRALIRDGDWWWLADDVYRNLFVAREPEDWFYRYGLEVVLPWGPGTMCFFNEGGLYEVIGRSTVSHRDKLVRCLSRAMDLVRANGSLHTLNSGWNPPRAAVPIPTPAVEVPQKQKSMRNSQQSDSVVKRKAHTGAYSE